MELAHLIDKELTLHLVFVLISLLKQLQQEFYQRTMLSGSIMQF